ncbi:hypothetical protein [Bizionia paragorgiae]|uniref:Uncharacterized protein n=1 Tax=Bizionia paragorgiae TaxID=283786 RepID=A0A1H3YNM0_BIZPA|nr:hypothetical protein [Bizionia paragorgiae]SEA12781.1 hypothetical protein SAMN04487990_1076 [Bizionia paragorgiae]
MNKQTKDSIISNTVFVASAVGGAKLSDGLVGLLPINSGDTTTKRIAQGALILIGIGGSVMIKGKSMFATASRAASLGNALIQANNLVNDVVADSGAVKPATPESTPAEKAMSNAFGLGCGCQEEAVSYPLLQMPSLNFAMRPSVERNYGIREGQAISASLFN